MSSCPVTADAGNTLCGGIVPIIFVPGVMGSRLAGKSRAVGSGGKISKLPTEAVLWDPDNHWQMARLIAASASTTERHFSRNTKRWVASLPVEGEDELPSSRAPAGNPKKRTRSARGWLGVSASFYGTLLTKLHRMRFGSIQTPVYAVGYDWRQSNAKSAEYAAQKIAEILDGEGAKTYVLVTHSMGGLMTRNMLKRNLESVGDKLAGVIHVAQPVDGAPALYRRVHTGMKASNWVSPLPHPIYGNADGTGTDAWGLAKILGNTAAKVKRNLARAYGPLQLLPTKRYEAPRQTFSDYQRKRGAWHVVAHEFADVPKGNAVEDRKVGYDDYTGEFAPPSLISNHQKGTSKKPKKLLVTYDAIVSPIVLEKVLKSGLIAARAFHRQLGRYHHKKTWAVFGVGEKTESRVVFVYRENLGWVCPLVNLSNAPGDGSVPYTSGAALDLGEQSVFGSGMKFDLDRFRTFRISGGMHDKIMGNRYCLELLEQIIGHAIRKELKSA